MAEQQFTYLRKWRQKRGYTQAQVVSQLDELGGDLPKTEASLSRLETGKQPWSQPIIEALAQIYQVEPWELIGNDPTKEGKVIDLLRVLNERDRLRAEAFIQGMRESGEA